MEMYLSADIDLASDNGKMKHKVVMIACSALNKVIPSFVFPVTSGETPKLLQVITKSLVTTKC
jgi:hypothetical protein